ncbi:MAG: hypothetical protein K0S72_1531, partial [Arthrobacter sp.]|nr:hypothetical protein [Arthrobacter sp.]
VIGAHRDPGAPRSPLVLAPAAISSMAFPAGLPRARGPPLSSCWMIGPASCRAGPIRSRRAARFALRFANAATHARGGHPLNVDPCVLPISVDPVATAKLPLKRFARAPVATLPAT